MAPRCGTAHSPALANSAAAFGSLGAVCSQKPRVFLDRELNAADQQKYSLLLLGGPAENAVAANLATKDELCCPVVGERAIHIAADPEWADFRLVHAVHKFQVRVG